MKKKLKCYISSDSTYDLSKLENILLKLTVETSNFYDFSIGSSFSDLIRKKIKECDFIIAFITQKNQNVLFELGIAEALGKPILLLTEQDVKLPFFLEGKMSFHVDWSKSTQLLELSLKNYILDISNRSLRYKRKKFDIDTENLTFEYSNENLIKLKKYRSTNFTEIELINLILNVFKKLNIQAVSDISLGNFAQVDIAITNETLSQYFGNPILFEVKAGKLNKNIIEDAQYQLQSYLRKAEANFGILLYFDKDDRRFGKEIYHSTNILALDIEDFIQGISEEGFESFLIRARNENAHRPNNQS